MQGSKSEVPHFELNASIERNFMENRDKNIFCPPTRMKVPESMKDKSRYYAHHEDFCHLKDDCRNLYRQIMYTIKKGGLQQYLKRDNGTPRMVKQPGQSNMQKGKAIAEQRIPIAEQQLRMVPMIAGPTMVTAEEEKKSRHEKRTDERVKHLRALGHTVNYVSA